MNDREYKVERVLRWYSKDPDDDLVGEELLKNIKLEELHRIFEEKKDNPMFECYPVKDKHIAELQKYLETKIDLSSYDYFVEADSK